MIFKFYDSNNKKRKISVCNKIGIFDDDFSNNHYENKVFSNITTEEDVFEKNEIQELLSLIIIVIKSLEKNNYQIDMIFLI